MLPTHRSGLVHPGRHHLQPVHNRLLIIHPRQRCKARRTATSSLRHAVTTCAILVPPETDCVVAAEASLVGGHYLGIGMIDCVEMIPFLNSGKRGLMEVKKRCMCLYVVGGWLGRYIWIEELSVAWGRVRLHICS